jgi:AAA15 family ATPase/GTPase
MKIEYLEIKNYKQFTDLTLDLTYPKGHEKEGQPLDKICIIGQSGTGKTNLLEIIKKSTVDFSEFEKDYYPLTSFTGEDDEQKFIFNKFKTKKQTNVEVILIDESLEYFANNKKISQTSTITFKDKKKIN